MCFGLLRAAPAWVEDGVENDARGEVANHAPPDASGDDPHNCRGGETADRHQDRPARPIAHASMMGELHLPIDRGFGHIG